MHVRASSQDLYISLQDEALLVASATLTPIALAMGKALEQRSNRFASLTHSFYDLLAGASDGEVGQHSQQ